MTTLLSSTDINTLEQKANSWWVDFFNFNKDDRGGMEPPHQEFGYSYVVDQVDAKMAKVCFKHFLTGIDSTDAHLEHVIRMGFQAEVYDEWLAATGKKAWWYD